MILAGMFLTGVTAAVCVLIELWRARRRRRPGPAGVSSTVYVTFSTVPVEVVTAGGSTLGARPSDDAVYPAPRPALRLVADPELEPDQPA